MNFVLEDFVIRNHKKAEEWLDANFSNVRRLVYNSADIRFSGYKISSVDTNAFPAGFTNISDIGRERAGLFLKDFLQGKNVKNLLIIAENHTRNIPYILGLKTLQQICKAAGFACEVVALDALERPLNIENEEFFMPSFVVENGQIITSTGFKPDFIILNNDLTGENSGILENITTEISPPVYYGWNQRLKTEYFNQYNALIEKFAKDFAIDPWLFSCFFTRCNNINFHTKTGLECIAGNVEVLIKKIQAKYTEYGIKDQPTVFVKSNKGTYGMGVMSVNSSDEIININKEYRKKMNKIKHGTTNTDLIIQEGIPSVVKIDKHTAEAVAYIVNGKLCDIFYRYHSAKNSSESLNSVGATFKTIANILENPSPEILLYSIIARIAALACIFEKY